MSIILRTLAILVATVCTASAFDPRAAVDVPMVRQANAWKPGQPLPAGLLHYRASEGDISLATDSDPVFGSITNYDLLQEVIFTPCESKIFQLAVEEALSVAGPNRFFGDLRSKYKAHPEILRSRRHRQLYARTKVPCVVVDGLFIRDADMRIQERDIVLAQITANLRSGTTFQTVYGKYWKKYQYQETETFDDGKRVTLDLTHIGNLGDFLVALPPEDRSAFFRYASCPEPHIRPLLKRKQGEVIVLRDESEHRNVLYQVREAYSPAG